MPEGQYDERVIAINRVAKVVKGGRRFSFTALVVVGDGDGQRRSRLRQGEGGAGRDPEGDGGGEEEPLRGAARRFDDHPRRSSASTTRREVLLKPASPGTGVIAGGAARAILEAAGIHDVLAKSLGSSNAINVARATMQGLRVAAPSRRRRRAARQVAGRGRDEGDAQRVPRASARQARSHRGRVADGTQLKVTLVRSKIGTKPKHRGTLRALGLRRIGSTQHAARPPRSPRDARASAASRLGRGDPVKVHDLKPAPGFASAEATRRPRHRRQGRQDRRPRLQGSGRARHGARRLRRRPDAAAPAHAEGEGIQEPVPHRVPRREPDDARGVRRGRRGHAGHAA